MNDLPNYQENKVDDEITAMNALKLKQCGHELNCRFCRKQFETKELLVNHQTDWKDCISRKQEIIYCLINIYHNLSQLLKSILKKKLIFFTNYSGKK